VSVGASAEHESASAPRIRFASSADDVARARALFVEYAQWLSYDLCFQGFEQEIATLPGAYAPPRGRLLVVGAPGDAFGCIALRPIDATTGEVKRLFVREGHRGENWGRQLAETLIDEARGIGYRQLKLDTLESMHAARALYTALGFRPCEAYYHNPLPGVIYMSLRLDGSH
jgi:GNAT superfamily N-acetyltransferase